MKLTIITPSIRVKNIKRMAKDIPDGVRWIVIFDRKRLPAKKYLPKNAECYAYSKSTRGYPQSNFGLDKVNDGWVYFLDDDTTLHKYLISVVKETIKSNPECDFIHFDQAWPDGTKRIGGLVKKGKIDKGSYVIKRDLIGKDRFKNCASADGMFAEKIIKKAKKAIYIPEILSMYNALRPIERDKYTIIIPTMWFHPQWLEIMVEKYDKCSYVYEILIINNNDDKRIPLPYNKVRIIGSGENIFVNPAWNMGVEHCKTRKLVLANDDIVIHHDLEDFFYKMDRELEPGMVIGPHSSCMPIYGLKKGPVTIHKGGETMGAGAGIFMVMHKDSYHMMPDELPIWHGDLILYDINRYYTFRGVEIETNMRGTSDKLNYTKEDKLEERKFFLRYKANGYCHPDDRLKKLRVVLCLRSGGDFDMFDVELLSEHLCKYAPSIKIICLTDLVEGEWELTNNLTLIPLRDKQWSGWWSKMNLFNPVFEYLRPFLYLDLDTAVVNDQFLDFLPPVPKLEGDFITLGDFYRPGRLASGMMWVPKNNKKIQRIWDTWKTNPKRIMSKYRGDQDFIADITQADAFFQNLTNHIVTFKPAGRWRISLPDRASIVCFHGTPRIRQAVNRVKWIKQYVRGEI